MQFETALNLAWIVLGLIALGCTANSVLRGSDLRRGRAAWLHLVGVGLIIAALFPYISATDDVVRIEHFRAEQRSHAPSRPTKTDNLVRLYEALDTPSICAAVEIAYTPHFVKLVAAAPVQPADRIAPSEAGRSPPFLAL